MGDSTGTGTVTNTRTGAGAGPAAGTNMNRGLALVLLSAASFGLMPVFAKLAYEQMPFPAGAQVKTVLAIRFGLAAIMMWALWVARRNKDAEPEGRRPARRITVRDIVPLVAMGALGYVGQSFSYFTAASIISASATGLLLYTYPIIVTLLAWIFYRESLSVRKVAALATATLGALMVLGVLSGLLGLSELTLGKIDPSGASWALAAALIYSAYIIAGTRFARAIPPLFSSAVIITSAAVVYTVWGLATGELRLDIGPAALFWAVAIAVICTVVAIAAFFAGLRLVGPSRAAIASTLEPAVTVLSAASILQERITLEQVAGGALVLCSVLVLQMRAGGRRRAKSINL